MKGNILIVGGYGSVGSIISTSLADRFPGQVIVAGRNYKKAKNFATENEDKIIPRKLDISHNDDVVSVLDDNVVLVVMCVENQDTRFVEECIIRKIKYIDISATYEQLSKIETLDSMAKDYGSTVLLSVGIAPGLTNLLASYAKSELDDVDNLDIFILIGMGEIHGESSNQWVIDNLNAEYNIRQSGVDICVRAFGDYKNTIFSSGIGKRSAFRFNFSDQHTIVKTLGIDSASTWMCVDPAFFSWFFYVGKKLGLLNLLKIKFIQKVYLKILSSTHIGSDLFIAQVVANGTGNGEPASIICSVKGHGEGRTTALVAAEVAEHLHTSTTPAGVLHIDQLFDKPESFFKKLYERAADIEYRFSTKSKAIEQNIITVPANVLEDMINVM